MKKVIGLVIGLLPITTNAECVPVPDCISIGYTKTSCNGNSLKCPFDSSKLKCFPCDSSFRYTCSGDNVKNPIGNACNNKYVSCECEDRTTFINGECLCDTSCDTIGNIYYSDGTCSSCNLSNKTAIGVIAYKNNNTRFIVALNTISMPWSTNQTDSNNNITAQKNIIIPEMELKNTDILAREDLSGFQNTKSIVEYYGKNATDVAATYCYNYTPTSAENTKGQWFLPSLGQLYYGLYTNQSKINSTLAILGASNLFGSCHWSSTQQSSSTAWNMGNWGGSGCCGYRDCTNIVRCFLAI